MITDGSGTIMTGGTYVDQASEYQKKDRAKGITGGVAREVKAGDVIVLPPGSLPKTPSGKLRRAATAGMINAGGT